MNYYAQYTDAIKMIHDKYPLNKILLLDRNSQHNFWSIYGPKVVKISHLLKRVDIEHTLESDDGIPCLSFSCKDQENVYKILDCNDYSVCMRVVFDDVVYVTLQYFK
jgi:hypothetical protein